MAAAARREVAEEAGITTIDDPRPRAAIDIGAAPVGVLLSVRTGSVRSREARGSVEGRPEWISPARLGEIPLDGDPPLLPGIFAARRLLYGRQDYGAEGRRLPARFAPDAGWRGVAGGARERRKATRGRGAGGHSQPEEWRA